MTERPSNDDPVLTLDEAAAVVRVSPRTMHRYVKDGRISALRTPGGQLRFRRADVEALLTERASA